MAPPNPTSRPSAKASAHLTKGTAEQAAKEVGNEAKSAATDVADEAKAAASDLADSATAKAQKAADQAKSAAAEKKGQASDALSDVATALHDTGDSLREHDRDAFADYADQAARSVERFTSGIRDRNVGEILDEAERFARREPGLFIGGAFLLGIFGARFLKASSPEASSANSEGQHAGGTRTTYRPSRPIGQGSPRTGSGATRFGSPMTTPAASGDTPASY